MLVFGETEIHQPSEAVMEQQNCRMNTMRRHPRNLAERNTNTISPLMMHPEYEGEQGGADMAEGRRGSQLQLW